MTPNIDIDYGTLDSLIYPTVRRWAMSWAYHRNSQEKSWAYHRNYYRPLCYPFFSHVGRN
jgi:hypothetical protein